MDRITLRASALDSWNECPRRAYARMFREDLNDRGVPVDNFRPNYNTLVGSCVHTLAAHSAKGRKEQVADWFASQRQGIEQEGTIIESTDTVDGWNDAHEQATRILRKISKHPAIKQMREGSEDLLVENQMRHEFPSLTLTGRADLFNKDSGTLLDVKCSAKNKAPRHDAQLGAYSLLLHYDKKWETKRSAIVWMPVVKLSKPQPDPVEVEYSPAATMNHAVVTAGEARRIIEQAHAKAEKHGREVQGGDLPANPNSQMCSKKFCPAFGTSFCPAHPRGE